MSSEAGHLHCLVCSHEVRRHFRHPSKRTSMCCRDCVHKICVEGESRFDFTNPDVIVITAEGAVQKIGHDAWRRIDTAG